MLYLAWKHGGADPYCLYHGLNADYTPVGGGGDPLPPAFPSRVRSFVYGCAQKAEKDVAQAVSAGAGAAGMV